MSHTSDASDRESTADSAPTTPRWVKLFGLAIAVLLLLLAIMFAMGGNHGPGRHLPSGGANSYTADIARGVYPL